jgi:DNA-binding GntR family transcriptional regulator
MVSKRPKASRLQRELARRVLGHLKDHEAGAGYHLVELELCRLFDVSRTPVRGALRLLAGDGVLTRQGRGYVLARLPNLLTEDAAATEDQDWHRLFQSLARARAHAEMPDAFTQQEVVRRFSARLSCVMHVLRHLAELDLVERKPGNGWAFIPDPGRILSESYAFRRALEPQMLLQPGFRLDRGWAEKARGQHQKLRKKP